MRFMAVSTLVILGLCSCADQKGSMLTTQKADFTESRTTDRDTSTINQGHRESNVDQAPSDEKKPTDDDISSNIRQQMMKSHMAANIQNVKITTQDGMVTLKGLVKTAEEKQKVEQIAQGVAGTDKVDSWLEVE